MRYTDVPRRVRGCIDVAAQIAHEMREHIAWGETPGALLAFWEREDGEIMASGADLYADEYGEGAHDAVTALRALVAKRAILAQSAGRHIFALGIFSEKVFLDDDVDEDALMAGSPAQAAERVADLVAKGKIKQSHAVVGQTEDGWRFEYAAPRHGPPTITVCAPGRTWRGAPELADALNEAVDKLVCR